MERRTLESHKASLFMPAVFYKLFNEARLFLS